MIALLWKQSAQGAMHHAGWGVAASLALAFVSLLVAATGLKCNPQTSGSFHTTADYERRWQVYQTEFGDQQDTVIVLRGEDPARLTEAEMRVEAALTYPGRPFEQVLAFRDLTPWRAKAMHAVPLATLQAAEHTLQRRVTLSHQIAGFEKQLAGIRNTFATPGATNEQSLRLTELNRWYLEQEQFSRTSATHSSDKAALLRALYAPLETYARTPFLSADHREAYLFLKLQPEKDELLPGAAAANILQRVLTEVREEFPQVSFHTAGNLPREIESQRQTLFVLVKCAGMCLLGTCLLLGIGFGNWRQASAILLTLFVSLSCWAGLVTLAMGDVSSFHLFSGLALLPLLLASAVYYLANYLELRKQGCEIDTAIEATASSVGPNLSVACLTIAVTMFALRGGGYVPLTELGLITSGGMLLGLFAICCTLPATLHWLERTNETNIENQTLQLSVVTWLPNRLPLLTLFITALAICAVIPGVYNLRFDFFSTNKHAAAYIMCDSREQRDELRRQLLSSDQIAAVDEFAPPTAGDDPLKRRAIVKLSTLLEQLSQSSGPSPITRLATLESQANQLFSDARNRDLPSELLVRMNRTLRQWETEASSASDANTLPQWISLLPFMNPDAPRISELSPALVSRTLGKTGKSLLRVYPREDLSQRGAWHRFVLEVERIAPNATGPAIQTWHHGKRLQSAYLQAALFSLLTLAIVQLLVEQSIARTLLSMSPAILGLATMFGLAGWCDVSLTPLSALAWPVVLTLGIGCGRLLTGEISRTNALVLAITLSTGLIMLVSVPCLISSHTELQSLGRLLMFGAVGSWCASLFVVPALSRTPMPLIVIKHDSTPSASVTSSEPEVMLSVEALTNEPTPALVRPHRRLVQPTRVNATRSSQDRAA